MLRIVPMLNPDGVVLGNYRHPFPLIPFPSSFSAAPRPSLSLAPTHTRPLPCLHPSRCGVAGVDLNRQWAEPSEALMPTVHHLKRVLRSHASNDQLLLFCDLHGKRHANEGRRATASLTCLLSTQATLGSTTSLRTAARGPPRAGRAGLAAFSPPSSPRGASSSRCLAARTRCFAQRRTPRASSSGAPLGSSTRTHSRHLSAGPILAPPPASILVRGSSARWAPLLCPLCLPSPTQRRRGSTPSSRRSTRRQQPRRTQQLDRPHRPRTSTCRPLRSRRRGRGVGGAAASRPSRGNPRLARHWEGEASARGAETAAWRRPRRCHPRRRGGLRDTGLSGTSEVLCT